MLTDAVSPKAAPCRCKFGKLETSEQIQLSLDTEVLDSLRATGADWEVRFNAILREWLQARVS